MPSHVPTRTCSGCRQRLPKTALVRLSASQTRGIVVTGVLGEQRSLRNVTKDRDSEGRGLYMCPDLQCATRALRPIRGRLKIETSVDRLAAQLLREATSQAHRRFQLRKNGLARRRFAGQDARLRAWGQTLARLDAVVQTALDSGVL